ncbi:MAG TPA: heme ABC exporter ATP-binding protein CcmA [Acidimicrobiales bacterium]|nr:heme ABC exporter ATP-binding protein CcmA [Acidimicrobiales bacterium]
MAVVVRFRAAVALIGRFPALAGVDLDVASGEVLLVTGPNGAGKTSLLRACAGLLAVTGGEAHVLGHDLRRDRRSVRRSVAMLGHATFLYDDLTVVDNVRFAVRAARSDLSAVDPALAQLGLGGRLRHTAVGKLSAGQRRRVAIATVVARAPELWLLDEPHAGLDAAGRDILDEVIRAASSSGATILLASHETERAGALAGRVARMAGGQVVAVPVHTEEPVHVA